MLAARPQRALRPEQLPQQLRGLDKLLGVADVARNLAQRGRHLARAGRAEARIRLWAGDLKGKEEQEVISGPNWSARGQAGHAGQQALPARLHLVAPTAGGRAGLDGRSGGRRLLLLLLLLLLLFPWLSCRRLLLLLGRGRSLATCTAPGTQVNTVGHAWGTPPCRARPQPTLLPLQPLLLLRLILGRGLRQALLALRSGQVAEERHSIRAEMLLIDTLRHEMDWDLQDRHLGGAIACCAGSHAQQRGSNSQHTRTASKGLGMPSRRPLIELLLLID